MIMCQVSEFILFQYLYTFTEFPTKLFQYSLEKKSEENDLFSVHNQVVCQLQLIYHK